MRFQLQFCSGVVANLEDEDESNKKKKKKRKKNKIISENEDSEDTNEKYEYGLFVTICFNCFSYLILSLLY